MAATTSGEESDPSLELPRPPPTPRRMRWRAPQVVGLALVSILPVLALARVLDPRPHVAHASSGPVELSVSAPARMRYRMTEWLILDVRNPSARPLTSVTVELDAAFVEGFAQVSFMPQPARVDGRSYAVDLGGLAAGESRRVSVQVQAEKYGTRSGSVSVLADRGRVSVPIEVFVLP